jgi:dTDP-4-amino-4,6-dideoxygalactose transaminase
MMDGVSFQSYRLYSLHITFHMGSVFSLGLPIALTLRTVLLASGKYSRLSRGSPPYFAIWHLPTRSPMKHLVNRNHTKMRKDFLPLSPPCISDEEIAEVADTLRSDWITTGPKVKRFEQEFAEAVGAPAAVALSSCTAALHLALTSLGIGPGDAVLTTPMTFCSGVHVIEQVGARPVLIDVEPDTLNIDPAKIRQAIETWSAGPNRGYQLKAILPVHLYGHACEMNSLLQIAQEHRLAVIDDAAHALPASYMGRNIGSQAASAGVPVLTCFSFYATKNLTTAEGGMLTGQPEILEEARIWSLHGMNRDAWKRYGAGNSWFYEVTRPGFKYNMTDLQAAIGLHQLAKLSRFRARRAAIARRYNAAFSAFDHFQITSATSRS